MSDEQTLRLYLSMVEFGKHLAEIRKSRSLTQLELADLLDAQPRMIGRWEQGIAKPQFDYIIKLAQVLEVSLDYLLMGTDGQISPQFQIKNKRLKALCQQADQLKPQDQDIVCHFLDMAIKHDQLKQIVANPASVAL